MYVYITSRSILRITRNVSDKTAEENRNTRLMFSEFFFFPKIW